MARSILLKEDDVDAAPASSEVEFALVLSRIIDSVNADPLQLRASLYELARHKLGEQIADEDPEDQSRIVKSLEVAIRGVEIHFRRQELRLLGGPEGLGSPSDLTPRIEFAADTNSEGRRPTSLLKGNRTNDQSGKRKFLVPWGYVTMLALAATIGFTIQQRDNPAALLKLGTGSAMVASPMGSNPPQAFADHIMPAQPETARAEANGLVPTMFGVYAISDGKLHTLEMLPGRAPSPRVAISAAISIPSKTILPDRPIKFIVFRRDAATNALNRADVRVIAKISQAMKFDPSGKPVIQKADDTWVIRNISYPYRTAPYKGQPDMYEVVEDDPDKPLSPGRYALILKDEAYDFSIAGEISDSKQCLESIAAANGAFYAECRKR
jgi:hypothetical protein